MSKTRPTITAHCMVINEENYILPAINSVLPFVDQLIIFDTGSTDSTLERINEAIKKSPHAKKITLQKKGTISPQEHTSLRQEMLKLTTTDWILLLDGDEVWPEDQIKYLAEG